MNAKNTNIGTNGGRYQLIQLSEMRRDQFLVDSKTGQLWSRVCMVPAKNEGPCDYTPWMKEDIEGVNKSIKEIRELTDFMNKKK